MSEAVVVPDEILDRKQVLLEEARKQGMIVTKPKQGYVKWCEMVEEALLESFCKGASVRAACAAAGCSTNTFYEHFRQPGTFRERVVQARESLIGVVEQGLVLSCVEPDKHGRRDTQAIRFFLTNRAQDRYAERVDHMHRTGDLDVAESTDRSKREFTPESRKQAKQLARELILGRAPEVDTELEARDAAEADEEIPY